MRRLGRVPFNRLITAAGIALFSVLPTIVLAAAVSQGFKAASELTPGSLVALDKSSSNTVKLADSENIEDVYGVVVPSEGSVVSVSEGEEQVQVAIAGTVDVLVSDINGEIKAGDRITASPIMGVGMKATVSTKIIGVAQSDFDTQGEGVSTTSVRDKAGTSKTVSVGRVPLLVGAEYFVTGDGDERSAIPKWLRDLTATIAGKKVDPIRIVISVIILLLALGVVAVLIYGAVRSSIISIGRNPLSHGAIRKSLVQVLAVASVILVVSFGAIYLIITR
jgi:hypothetical protein